MQGAEMAAMVPDGMQAPAVAADGTQAAEENPLVRPHPEPQQPTQQQCRPMARRALVCLAAVAGLALTQRVVSQSVRQNQNKGPSTANRVELAGLQEAFEEGSQHVAPAASHSNHTAEPLRSMAAPPPHAVSVSDVDIPEAPPRVATTFGCYDDTAPNKLLTDGYNFEFSLRAIVSTAEMKDGYKLLGNACDAFELSINSTFARFKINGLLNVPDASGDGVEVTSAVPIKAEVPYKITVKKDKSQLCIEVLTAASSTAESEKVVDYVLGLDEFGHNPRRTCSAWGGEPDMYQMFPAGGLTIGPEEATQTGWSYKQLDGDIPLMVNLTGLDYARLMDDKDMQDSVRQAITQGIVIEGGWTLTPNIVNIVFADTFDGAAAIVSITPYSYDSLHDMYQKFEANPLGETITERLKQIPNILAVTSDVEGDDDDDNATNATVTGRRLPSRAYDRRPTYRRGYRARRWNSVSVTTRPLIQMQNCSEYFKPRAYETAGALGFGLGCLGISCEKLCYPDTVCANVICDDSTGMSLLEVNRNATCIGKVNCLDKCCAVNCTEHASMCPASACGEMTSAVTAKPSEADQVCCKLPAVDCCTADNAFCQACQQCQPVAEICAMTPDDPACQTDEAKECGLNQWSQFDSGTGNAMTGTSVIYGGTRAISGGIGTKPSGSESRVWVWDIANAHSVYNFSTDSPVLSIAPSADGLHALSGEVSGVTNVWDYVQGGPAWRTLDTNKVPVISIAGGFTYQQSYLNSGRFVTFWKWGLTVATYRVPRLSTEGDDPEAAEEQITKLEDALAGVAGALGFTDEQMLTFLDRIEASGGGGGAIGEMLADLTPEDLDVMRQMLALPLITAVVQLPGNSNFVSGDAEGQLRYFDILSLDQITGPLSGGHVGPVTCLAAFPVGNHILSGGVDGSIVMWDIASGEILRTFKQPWGGAIRSIVVMIPGDSFFVASDDGYIRQYWANDGSYACKQLIPGGTVLNVAMNPGNPNQLITSSSDGIARVFSWR